MFHILPIALLVTLLPVKINEYFEDMSLFYTGLASGCQSLVGVALIPWFGRLSDIHGRKPILYLPAILTIFPPLYLCLDKNLYVYELIHVLCGGSNAAMVIVFAYIADTTSKEYRSTAFSIVLGSLGAVFLVGAVVGTWILNNYGEVRLFQAATIAAVLDIVIIWMSPESRVVSSYNDDTETTQAKQTIPLIQQYYLLSQNTYIFKLILLSLITTLNSSATQSLVTTYIQKRYGFNSDEINNLLLLIGGGLVLVQLVFVPVTMRMTNNVAGVMFFSVMLVGLHTIFYGLSTEKWNIYASAAVGALGLMWLPLFQALISNHVHKDEQGLLQGIISAASNFAGAIGTQLFAFVFLFVQDNDSIGIPFIVSGSMVMAICLFILCTIPAAPTDNLDQNGEIKLLLTPQQSFIDEEEGGGDNDMSQPLIAAASIYASKTNSDVLGGSNTLVTSSPNNDNNSSPPI